MEKPKTVHRDLTIIKTEYSNLQFRSGDAAYKVFAAKKDLALLQEQMRSLESEFVAATNAAAEEKFVAAEPSPVANEEG